MNGLALDITILAFAVLFVSVGALLIGFMWHHRDCQQPTQTQPHTRDRTDRARPATERLLWDDEAWMFDKDPRDLLQQQQQEPQKNS